MDELLQDLVSKNLISEIDIKDILNKANKRGVDLATVLKEYGVPDEAILESKASRFNVPIKILDKNERIPFKILEYIPEESARNYKLVPLAFKDGVLEVGMTDPANLEALDALNFMMRKTGTPYKVYLISDSDLARVFDMYNSLSGEVGEALTELESELGGEEKKIQEAINEQESGQTDIIKEDAPVIKIVATILRYAVDGRASDVHIERVEKAVKVRFRVDGTLHTSLTLPAKIHNAVVARIKVLATMRLDERRKPQDGRFSATISGRKVDFRVSTLPTYFGEKIVMRILDRAKGFIPMEDLGLTDINMKQLRSAIQRPYGLILISGPTGSGKSTTLYSVLNELDRETKNIMSLEDPVEYYMDGINQSQIRAEIGYTFANALRTAMRQDPDIIMVGEIRDGETAKLAVQAALTGHLVLSTIHTNSAIGVIPRLIDMGVDPYLIAPTLVLAVAQRLVKRMCDGAAQMRPISEGEKAMLERSFADLPPQFRPEIPNEVPEAKATAQCPTGTRGRLAVFEMLPVDADVQHLILHDPTEEAIYALMRKRGMYTMKEDAFLKVFEQKTPFSEAQKLGGRLLAESASIPNDNLEPETSTSTEGSEQSV